MPKKGRCEICRCRKPLRRLMPLNEFCGEPIIACRNVRACYRNEARDYARTFRAILGRTGDVGGSLKYRRHVRKALDRNARTAKGFR